MRPPRSYLLCINYFRGGTRGERRVTRGPDNVLIAGHFYRETFVVIKLIPPGVVRSRIAQRMIDERYILITSLATVGTRVYV